MKCFARNCTKWPHDTTCLLVAYRNVDVAVPWETFKVSLSLSTGTVHDVVVGNAYASAIACLDDTAAQCTVPAVGRCEFVIVVGKDDADGESVLAQLRLEHAGWYRYVHLRRSRLRSRTLSTACGGATFARIAALHARPLMHFQAHLRYQ